MNLKFAVPHIHQKQPVELELRKQIIRIRFRLVSLGEKKKKHVP